MTTTKNADTRPILARALAEIRGRAELAAKLADVKRRAKVPLTNAHTLRVKVINSAAETILAGGDPPDDLGERLLAADRAPQAVAAARDAWDAVASVLEAHLREIERDGLDAALGVVHGDLLDLLDDVRDLDRVLGRIDTAQRAVDAGPEQADAWRRLTSAVERYDDVRTAQTHLLRLAGLDLVGLPAIIAEAGLIANITAVHPEWRAKVGLEATWIPRPWPEPDATGAAGRSHWPTTNKPAYLRWLATGPAEAWVPTMTELKAKRKEIATAINDALRARASAGGFDMEPPREVPIEYPRSFPAPLPPTNVGVDDWNA